MRRRTLLRSVAAALAAPLLAVPFFRAAAAQDAVAVGPSAPTAGPIDLGPRIKGWTADGVRLHSIDGHWIAGPEGTLAVDACWRTPEAREAPGRMEGITGRAAADIRAVAITHPRSDHYGGLEPYRAASGARARTTRPVARVIRGDEHGFYVNRREDFGDDIPAEIPAVDPDLAGGEPLGPAGCGSGHRDRAPPRAGGAGAVHGRPGERRYDAGAVPGRVGALLQKWGGISRAG